MPLTLSIRDHGDGSGVLATVSGSSGGTVTVSRSAVGVASQGAYIDAGTRTGNGTLNIAGRGYYWWKATEGVNVSVPVYQPATEEGDSTYDRCMTMAHDRIVALALPGEPSVFRYDCRQDANVVYPAIQLFCVGQAEEDTGGTNQDNDIAYLIGCAIADRRASETSENMPRFMCWRQMARDAFHFVPHGDLRVPELKITKVRFGPMVIPPPTAGVEYREGMFTIVCECRETR